MKKKSSLCLSGHANMTLKCKIAVTTDTTFRGREVQPGVDPDQCCTADSNKKVQTPFIQWKRQEVWISCYFLSVGKTFDTISIWFITTKNRVGSSSRVHFVAWGKNFVKLRREMVLSHVICRYLFAHRGSSRKSAENRQNMTSLVE